MLGWYLLALMIILLFGLFFYWAIIITEGVYFGRRLVVWLYDITADRYDRIKQFDPESEQFLVIYPLLNRLAGQPAPVILDVATGTGRLPCFLLEEPTFNGRIIGLDPSWKMLEEAQPKLAPFSYRAGLVQQTAGDLPFADETFAAVTCLESLEFFPSDTLALQEMVRVLQPGGLLLVTRRRGWEAKAFFGRYRDQAAFETLLQSLGLQNIETRLWQIEYDLLFAQKPENNGENIH